MAGKTSLAEAAAIITGRLAALKNRNVTMQEVLDLAVFALENQAALLRFLDNEFPDAEKIRSAVFEVRA